MSNANASLCRDGLLRDTCTHEARTGGSETSGNVTNSYAAPVTLKCNVAQPSSRWLDRWPDINLTDTVEFWLPAASAVARRDRITHNGIAYLVKDVADWQGAGLSALCEHYQGVTQ